MKAIWHLLQRRKMTTKQKGFRLTTRDIEVVKFVAEQNCVRLDTIGLLLAILNQPVEERRLRKLGERWLRLGLLQRQAMLAETPFIYWATSEGLRLANIPLHRGERTYSPSFATLHHNLAVARVAVEYKRHGCTWTSERQLREEMGDEHLADGLATYQSQRILVEVDRTLKEAQRLRKIMIGNSKLPNIDFVDYWTTSNLVKTLEIHRNSLADSVRNKIRIFVLPEEVNI